ncbi:hypothetical protein R3X27_01275 [Tropicimonas sp. TH_r6]|uniref:hypothetical protein n=1 Tax=Tropicimonas sp. TH_r6 TaxID=3082085 RepID=UPI0029546201|nr:hypothetical protein [Tropicimonas sp. TH_r6]MDV7141304.1 hypothetical protein [Tropicimonas sp. TH_r6]
MNSSAPLAPTPTGAVSYGAPVAEPIFTSDGIEAGATGREIDFNRAEPGAIEAMSKLMGQGPVSVSQACSGLRAARWKDGTTLFFELKPYDPPAFVGWRRASGQAGQTCAI